MAKKKPLPSIGPELDVLINRAVGITGSPSSNLVDAMRVVDYFHDLERRVRPQGSSFGSSIFKVDLSHSGYNVGFWLRASRYRPETEDYEFEGYCGKAKAETLPHAICLAAVVAMKLEY